MNQTLPQRPAEYAENLIIDGILSGRFSVFANLPAERELAAAIGVTRPTLREALQRLARDGWLEIRHGKPTRVRDYWHEGSLGVLSAIARRSSFLPPNFIPNLLDIRLVLAPAYAEQAVQQQPEEVACQLEKAVALDDAPEIYASYDWLLHHRLSVLSGNPIFTLILNGFCELYIPMAVHYFQDLDARRSSRAFYTSLQQAAVEHKPEQAAEITRQAMLYSIDHWREITNGMRIAREVR